ncbi:MAG: hypothetical protein L3J35_06365 [Bacteroidales bacterium]|nr:hypothetical protein [Bacteroidales bacterium]
MIEYVSGSLFIEDNRKVEIHLADCEVCNDEIEGLSNMKNIEKLTLIISSLNDKIDTRINQEKFKIPANSSNKFNVKRIFSIAASVALLITIGYVINNFADKSSDNLAQSELINEALPGEAELTTESEAIDELKETESSISEDVNTVSAEKNEETVDITASEDTYIEQTNLAITDKGGIVEDAETEYVYTEETVGENINTETDEVVIASYTDRKRKEQPNDTDEKADIEEDRSKKESAKSMFGFTKRGITSGSNETKPAAGINYLSMRNSGLLSYDVKSYEEAIEEFNKYLTYKPEDYEIVYKSGMSYYYLKKYNTAVTRFNKIINGDINKYVEDAQWYKSIILINQGKENEALSLLNQIVFKNGKYQKRALEAINQIENK